MHSNEEPAMPAHPDDPTRPGHAGGGRVAFSDRHPVLSWVLLVAAVLATGLVSLIVALVLVADYGGACAPAPAAAAHAGELRLAVWAGGCALVWAVACWRAMRRGRVVVAAVLALAPVAWLLVAGRDPAWWQFCLMPNGF
jgi:hypothetical protein